MDKKLKVAFVHDYLIQYGGAEKTLEAMLELWPNCEIFTGAYDKKNFSEIITSKKVTAIKNPFFKKFLKLFSFLMPFVFENFDLRKFDLVISDGTAWPKGVLTTPAQLHISYIHTPPRFLYGYSTETNVRKIWYLKPFVSLLDHFLRIWDFNAAQRPDYLVTNSKETQARIKKFYKRDATVIYPPVDVDFALNTPKTNERLRAEARSLPAKNKKSDYYVILGRLVAYKNFDLVIKAFNNLPHKLIVMGTGPQEDKLKKLAGNNIEFEGYVSESKKSKILSESLGVIYPVKDEDLGIVPIEAMAHGKPVLAHKSGGHLETIVDGETGMLFEDLSLDGFIEAFRTFDNKIAQQAFNEEKAVATAKKFSKERFKNEIKQFVDQKLLESADARIT